MVLLKLRHQRNNSDERIVVLDHIIHAPDYWDWTEYLIRKYSVLVYHALTLDQSPSSCL